MGEEVGVDMVAEEKGTHHVAAAHPLLQQTSLEVVGVADVVLEALKGEWHGDGVVGVVVQDAAVVDQEVEVVW